MKTIHPKYYPNAKVTCSCSNSFTIGSTLPEIRVDVCSKCHPFYTGQMKYLDTLGRVEKFKKSQAAAASVKVILDKKKQVREQRQKRIEETPKTLREMLLGK